MCEPEAIGGKGYHSEYSRPVATRIIPGAYQASRDLLADGEPMVVADAKPGREFTSEKIYSGSRSS